MDYLIQYLALIPFPEIDPVIFSIGPFDIRWYGLSYVMGILFGWIFARSLLKRSDLWPNNSHLIKKTNLAIKKTDLDDFVLWAALGIIIGGRLGYVLFYNFDVIFKDTIHIFQIWKGGMSFHGGLIGVIIAIMLFAHLRKFNVWNLFDIICAAAPVGIFFGRIANFINGELWGQISDAPWAMIFPEAGPFPRHPSQLYEALLEGVLLFIILAVLCFKFKMLKKPGFIAGAFIAGYASARIGVEFFREPDAHIGFLFAGTLTMGMLLSLPLLAAGLWAMLTAFSRGNTNGK